MKQSVSIVELKHFATASLNRALGPSGTVIDLDIEWIETAPEGTANWGVTRVSEEADPGALRRALAEVVPRLQALYELAAPRSPGFASPIRRPSAPSLAQRMDAMLREQPFLTVGVAAVLGLFIGGLFGALGRNQEATSGD